MSQPFLLRRHHVVRGVLYLLLLSLFLSTPTWGTEAGSSGVHFGANSAYILPPDGGAPWFTLDPTGDFVAGITDDGQQIVLHIWDLRATEVSDEPQALPIFRSYVLPNTKTAAGRLAAVFSPGGQYLAVQTSDSLILLSVPDLQALQVISVDGAAPRWFTPAWSPDERFFATLVDNGQILAVWDVQENQVRHHTLEHAYNRVHAWGRRWLITTSRGYSESSFALCAIDLKQCASYPGMGGVVAAASSRQIIVTERPNPAGQTLSIVGSWIPRSDGAFLLNEQKFSDWPLASIRAFSPNGQYFGAQTAEGLSVWNFDTLKIMHRSPIGDWGPIWLNDALFVAGGYSSENGAPVLLLYSLSQKEPLDELSIDTARLTDFILPEVFGPQTASSNGRRVLFNLGRGALLIPIVYE